MMEAIAAIAITKATNVNNGGTLTIMACKDGATKFYDIIFWIKKKLQYNRDNIG